MYRLHTFRVLTNLRQEEALHACFGCGLHVITTFGERFEFLPFAHGLGSFLTLQELVLFNAHVKDVAVVAEYLRYPP